MTSYLVLVGPGRRGRDVGQECNMAGWLVVRYLVSWLEDVTNKEGAEGKGGRGEGRKA